jgi:hypothetical protein
MKICISPDSAFGCLTVRMYDLYRVTSKYVDSHIFIFAFCPPFLRSGAASHGDRLNIITSGSEFARNNLYEIASSDYRMLSTR